MAKWWKRGSVIFWTDVASFVLLMGVGVTGGLLKWVLPHGGEGRGRGAGGAGAAVWMGMSRHEWGAAHFYLSVGMLAAVAIHLVSHFGWVRVSVPKFLGFGKVVKA